MPFEYFKPCPGLSAYIHSFWTLTTTQEVQDELHPDGCVDIILNAGCSFTVSQKDIVLNSHSVYLGGALTETIYEQLPAGVYLLGTRFRPGCFGCFYPPQVLGDLRDNCIEVDKGFLPPLQDLLEDPLPVLNAFFCKKLKDIHSTARDAAIRIVQAGGNTTLNAIAAVCNKSHRQTERVFKQHIGLTPKQFCNVIKYTCARELLAAKPAGETLLGVAIEAGYYDHAHLTRAYKKISRHTPSSGKE